MREDKPASPFPTLPKDLPPSSPLSLVAGSLLASEKAALLAGQFRRSEADDPDTFIASWTLVMQDFPPMVLDHVCHPAKGLAIRSHWMPTVKEVREACIEHFSLLIARWRNETTPRIEYRKPTPPPEPREKRLSLEELKAKHGPTWGIDSAAESVPRRFETGMALMTNEQIVAHYRNHGMARKPKQEKKHHVADQDETESLMAHFEQARSRDREEEQGAAERIFKEAADTGGKFAQD